MSTFYRIIFILCLSSSASFATHLLGGEIRAENVSGQTYKISAQLYFDVSPGGIGGADAQNTIKMCFGDGNTADVQRTSYTKLAGEQNGIAIGTYEVTYTYPSSGTFQISANVTNRTGNLLNFTNAEFSEMFLWTVISTQVQNSTPILPLPIFSAGAKQIFTVDLKPVVTDSDSITARLQKLSKSSPGTCGVRSINETYAYPNEVSKKGTFTIDRTNNKLVWNAPELLGNYIYAIVVDEWRNGIKISETYREGLILVTDKSGPTVDIPAYVPVNEAGIVSAIPDADVENLSMIVEAFPVPTEDFLTVNVNSVEPTTLRMQVINLDGQIVREFKTNTKTTQWRQQMDLRKITKGLYIIRVINDQGKFATQKVVR
jgi:hypothetical protein